MASERERTVTINYNGNSTCPDPEIMPAMENIGFDTQDIRESSKHRKFNETMAAYHLLRCQACQDNDSSVHTKLMDFVLLSAIFQNLFFLDTQELTLNTKSTVF